VLICVIIYQDGLHVCFEGICCTDEEKDSLKAMMRILAARIVMIKDVKRPVALIMQ